MAGKEEEEASEDWYEPMCITGKGKEKDMLDPLPFLISTPFWGFRAVDTFLSVLVVLWVGRSRERSQPAMLTTCAISKAVFLGYFQSPNATNLLLSVSVLCLVPLGQKGEPPST